MFTDIPSQCIVPVPIHGNSKPRLWFTKMVRSLSFRQWNENQFELSSKNLEIHCALCRSTEVPSAISTVGIANETPAKPLLFLFKFIIECCANCQLICLSFHSYFQSIRNA